MNTTEQIKKTPLYSKHIETGAKMVDFAGYRMPLQYQGIIAEHEQIRNRVGIQDLSHMGELEIRGEKALEFSNWLITNDLSQLDTGQILYTVICKEDGGILDDALAYRMQDRVLFVVNASNKEKIYDWILSKEKDGVRVFDLSEKTALIGVQGPDAEKVVQKITNVDLTCLGYYHFVEGKILDTTGIISRTGYTGEDGFELYVKNQDAEGIWDTLLVEGEAFGIQPVGLGARDTLRLESKYPLYGNELDENINPLEVGLKWVVKLDKEDFIGKDALVKIKEEKPKNKLIGFELTKTGVPRHGYKVYDKNQEEIGWVTSGTFSPTLKKPVGLALIKRKTARKGDQIFIEIRKKQIPALVVKTPFYLGSVKR